MNSLSRWCACALLSVSVTAVILAQPPALDVKMGLWEMTATTDFAGQMPAIDTSKMTPEQAAKVEAAMKGMMGPHTNVTKSCMTKEKFEKSNFMMTDQPGADCKHTLTSNTRTTLDASFVCTGERAMTGEIHLVATSPTSVKAQTKITGTNQGRTSTVTAMMAGKWLGADCGTTK